MTARNDITGDPIATRYSEKYGEGFDGIDWSVKMGPKCECHRCIKEQDITENGFPLNMVKMILCPECGNKRCPKASDHRLACTGSNESGQPGSVYS